MGKPTEKVRARSTQKVRRKRRDKKPPPKFYNVRQGLVFFDKRHGLSLVVYVGMDGTITSLSSTGKAWNQHVDKFQAYPFTQIPDGYAILDGFAEVIAEQFADDPDLKAFHAMKIRQSRAGDSPIETKRGEAPLRPLDILATLREIGLIRWRADGLASWEYPIVRIGGRLIACDDQVLGKNLLYAFNQIEKAIMDIVQHANLISTVREVRAAAAGLPMPPTWMVPAPVVAT